MNKLIEFWQTLDTAKGGDKEYIHQDDIKVLEPYRDKFFHQADKKRYSKQEHKNHIHVNLLPSPYMGDLKNAKVYFYMLNPGFAGQEYLDHEKDDIWRGLSASIRQEFAGNKYLEQYRFLFMHPAFEKTEGGAYIRSYLKSCISQYQTETNASYDDAVRFYANNICYVQAFPYHSEKYDGKLDRITRQLPSHQAARDFLLSISDDPSKLIFIVRGYRFFDYQIPQNSNMIPFTRACEYGVKYFPANQEWNGVKHGERLVKHLIKHALKR